MRSIFFDPQHYEIAGKWAQERIGNQYPFKDFTALTLVEDNRILATVLYCNFNGPNVEMHIASDGSRKWLNKAFLQTGFFYPFGQLGCRRVTGVVAESNKDAVAFDLALGFQIEGRMRQAGVDGSDLLVLGMLRDECRFLKRGRNVEQRRERTAVG